MDLFQNRLLDDDDDDDDDDDAPSVIASLGFRSSVALS